jgi:hypothetical protein
VVNLPFLLILHLELLEVKLKMNPKETRRGNPSKPSRMDKLMPINQNNQPWMVLDVVAVPGVSSPTT